MTSMSPSNQVGTANRQIARAAGTVMLTFVFGKAIGLVSYFLLSNTFGTGPEMEAYLAANRFSEILFNLIAGGALGSSFIPVFTTLLTQDDRIGAWRLASSIANLVLLVCILFGLLGGIFAPWVVKHLLVTGFEDPVQQALTVDLLRIQLPSAAVFGLSGLVMGVLNAHQRFLFPALAPSMYPLGIIIGVVVLAPRFGIYGVAWGVLIGSALHLLVQVPQLFRLPARQYIFTLGLRFAAVREVLLLMGPRLIGVGVVQLNFWVNTIVASHEPSSIAYITYAFVIMIMPQAAIAQSIAIASLPTFSAQAARGKLEEMRTSLAAVLRAVLLLSIPATVGLVMLRHPVVALMYQRGAFTRESTDMVAWALLWYAAGLVGHCIVEIASRAFFALHDTRTPVTVTSIAMLLNVAFSLLFWNGFSQLGLPPHGGLALANSLATGLEAIVLLMLMRRKLQGLEGIVILRVVGLGSLSALALGGFLWAWLNMLDGQSVWLLTLTGIGLGGAIYGVLLWIFGVSEVRQMVTWVLKKLAVRLRRSM